jgi:hypothetical protein
MKISVNIFDDNQGHNNVSCPGYVMLLNEKKLGYGLKPKIVYAFTAKGWDMKNLGREVYKIENIGWVPASQLKIIHGIIPN